MRRNISLIYAALAGLLIAALLAGCGPSNKEGPDPAPPLTVFPESGLSFSAHIQEIFNVNCIACHAEGRVAGFLPLTAGASYGAVVSVPAVSLALPGIRVIPGDAVNSVIFKRVSGLGLPDPSLRMPLVGPRLNSNAENAIRAWINEGALNN